LSPVFLVTAECLASATKWEHRLGTGGPYTKLHLDDGRIFTSSEIRGVLNRLAFAPESAVGLPVDDDRDYAGMEFGAFYLSWLYALPRVINRPTPQGLCGRWRHPSEWALLAAKAGFQTQAYRSSVSGDQVDPAGGLFHLIVLRGIPYGAAVPKEQREACRNLALSTGTDLLGIDISRAGNGALVFAHATPFPDLTVGGHDLIQGLKLTLEGSTQ
jgi:hypothetical protein